MISGFGLGFRQKYSQDLLESSLKPEWLELLADNHATVADRALAVEVSNAYSVALHSVGMNLGGTAPIDVKYCERLSKLADDVGASFVSDHLAFTAVGNRFHHDLWPVPRSIEAVDHLGTRIQKVQSIIGRRLYVENVSTYVRHESDTMSELEFLLRLRDRTKCGFILDLNNLAINEFNHGENALELMSKIDPASIAYVHIAGGELRGDVIVDTHSTAPTEAVLNLLITMRNYAPEIPILLEWDAKLPSYSDLMDVLSIAQNAVKK